MAIKRQYGLNPIVEGVYNSTLYQPQMQNHFELVIDLTRDFNGGTNENGTHGLRNQRRHLNLAVTSFSLPTITTNTVDIPFGNTTVHLAGKTEFGGANSISCVDYIGADIERILYNWQMMVTNPETGQQGWAYNYKTDATVIEYAPDGSSISAWVLRGLFPTEINYGSLDKESGGLKQIEVTLAYDLAYKKYDSSTGRTKHETNAEIAAGNMAWKSANKYESYYGEKDDRYSEAASPGPLSAASLNDGVGDEEEEE